ncbi:bifunctional pyr operon transcriptional regulator/uracil phosphoribosyltransferase PyrR [bacterium]|nr:bifunctional pyr operon transcriptional regulator/uracil phosphoribosyltransferase PyrR [bacterium]
MARKGENLVRTGVVADTERLEELLRSLVDRVASEYADESDLVVVGVRAGGERLAYLLAQKLEELRGDPVRLGFVDITLYRDDLYRLGYLPEVGATEIDFPIDDVVVLLADDVLYTGRTVRAAIDELVDFGRPRAIRLVVVAERPGRELPLQPDYVGLSVSPAPGELVLVRLDDPEPGIFLYRRRGES